MPYIGNQHVAGDHVNNFKVLDDISTYTATFNGSSTNDVSAADDTIRVPDHRFIQGQRVTYNNGGGSNIGGLTSGTAYYVSFHTSNTIKLETLDPVTEQMTTTTLLSNSILVSGSISFTPTLTGHLHQFFIEAVDFNGDTSTAYSPNTAVPS